VVGAAVPWSRHGARFTWEFEDRVAWLVARSAPSTVATLLRISWRSVAGIVTRAVGSQERGRDLDRVGHFDDGLPRPRLRNVDLSQLLWPGPLRTFMRAFNPSLHTEPAL
jgi:hypothetical protein